MDSHTLVPSADAASSAATTRSIRALRGSSVALQGQLGNRQCALLATLLVVLGSLDPSTFPEPLDTAFDIAIAALLGDDIATRGVAVRTDPVTETTR